MTFGALDNGLRYAIMPNNEPPNRISMRLFVDASIAHERKFDGGLTRYELAREGEHHDHLICTSCGKIVEFVDDDIEDIQEKIAKFYHFKLQRHIHQLFGICRKCRKKP
mgnify:CR=1 FL=1